MKIKIFLHGHLKDKVGKDYLEEDVKTAREALSRLDYHLSKKGRPPLSIGRWKVIVKHYESKESLYNRLRHNIIHVYPRFCTAKNVFASIGNTIVAAVKTWYGILSGQWAWDPDGFAKNMGKAMGGVMELLGLGPSLNTSEEIETNSKYFGTIGNTVAAGTRIPFGYGLFKVSGHFISYNVSSTTVKVISKE
jgi:predicted phage tail protein